jgi:glycosyltransferase involved in cell wall biosynthesis
MPLLNKVLIGGLAILTSSNILESKMKEYDTKILQPIDMVSVIIPSYDEEQFIETALISLRNQSIIEKYPMSFEFILVDSGSRDNTVKLATPYVDKIITTDIRGKLTARNLGACHSNGNIIVAVDSDTYYPINWLNSILTPFNDHTNPKYENIVGVFGSTFDYSINNVPGQLFSLADFLYNYTLNRTRMVGRNSAYWKHTFYLADRFDETVNQFNIFGIFNEEEKMFGYRLSKLGKIIYKMNASCYHLGGFKSLCRLGMCNKQVMDKYQFGKDRF